MAMQVDRLIVGVDVAKAELVIHHDDRDEIIKIKNAKPEIKKWLKQQAAHTAIAVEATNVYHLDLVELAHGMGFQVYVVDGFQLSNYRKGVGGRVKTDPSDARLLSRFLRNEGNELRPWSPPPGRLRQAPEPAAAPGGFGDCAHCDDPKLGQRKST